MKYTILKKNGTTENFESNKIKVAIRKSANRIGVTLDDDTCDRIVEQIKENMVHPQITVAEMHKLVCRVLKRIAPDVAMSYQNYRDYKTTYAEDFDKLFQQTKDVLYLGDRENANFDSALISTKGSLIRGYLTKSLYQKFYLTKRELEATRRGDIYIHDMRDMLMGSFNCFSGDTKFISSVGVRTFRSFNDGDIVYVPTHTGRWKRAVVRCYGKQKLQYVYFKRGAGKEQKIAVTQNHRWILKDGTETTNLKVGDRLCETPNITKYDWDSLSLTDKRIWCMGFNLGDGSSHDNSWSSIRLCGDKNKWASRFEDAGFKVYYPEYYNGDARVVMSGIKKEIPFGLLHHENINVFSHGLMCADGSKNPETFNSEYRSICVTGNLNNHINDILQPAGYYVTSKKDITDKPTNFGQRSATTITYQLYSYSGDRTWKVVKIEDCK